MMYDVGLSGQKIEIRVSMKCVTDDNDGQQNNKLNISLLLYNHLDSCIRAATHGLALI